MDYNRYYCPTVTTTHCFLLLQTSNTFRGIKLTSTVPFAKSHVIIKLAYKSHTPS